MLYYITHTYIPSKKAFGYAIAKMCSSFAENIPVTLVIPKSSQKEINEDIYSYYNVPKNFKVIELSTIDLFRFSFIPNHLAFIMRKVSFSLAVLFSLKLEKDDICYSRDMWTLILMRLRTPKIFLEIHHLYKLEIISVHFLRLAHKIVVITSFLKNELISLGYKESDIHIAPDAVDLSDFSAVTLGKKELCEQLGLPENKTIVLYSGNLFAWKGVYTLVDAFESVRNTSPDSVLVFVGGSDDTLEAFRAHVDSKSYKDNVMVLGHKKHEEVAGYLLAADILVLPNSAKEKISKFNTSPLKLFEYMASGKPIVSSDLPSMREVLSENNAFFAEPDDANSLGKALSHVIKNPNEAAAKSSKAKEDAKRFTWTERASGILNFINAL